MDMNAIADAAEADTDLIGEDPTELLGEEAEVEDLELVQEDKEELGEVEEMVEAGEVDIEPQPEDIPDQDEEAPIEVEPDPAMEELAMPIIDEEGEVCEEMGMEDEERFETEIF